MNSINRSINPHISVDCLIFGFSKQQLKVLLIERRSHKDCNECLDFKLPGDFISLNEDLEHAAYRILEELTGMDDIYLRPFTFFGRPERIGTKEDLDYLSNQTGYPIRRVVTAAYFSLINIKDCNRELVKDHMATWIDVQDLPKLAYDHLDIVEQGLEFLKNTLKNEPIGFELLPEKFTIRELQGLYEAVLNSKLDNRNFRKKILKSDYLVQLDEKQAGVAHKPAYYYRFDQDIFDERKKEDIGFNF